MRHPIGTDTTIRELLTKEKPLEKLRAYLLNPNEAIRVRTLAALALVRRTRFQYMNQDETWKLLCQVAEDESIPTSIREIALTPLRGDQGKATLFCLTNIVVRSTDPLISYLAIQGLSCVSEGLEKAWARAALERIIADSDSESTRFHAATALLSGYDEPTAETLRPRPEPVTASGELHTQ